MRRTALLAATVTVTTLAAVSVMTAAPASADHVIDVFPEGQCRWGKYANPVRIDLFTAKIQIKRDSAGLVTSYTCHFKDIPAFVAEADRAYTPDGGDWYLPQRATELLTVTCWSPDIFGPIRDGRFGEGVGKITPSGNATMKCTLEPES